MHPPKQFNFIQTTCIAAICLPLVMGFPLLPSASESTALQRDRTQKTNQKAFRRGTKAPQQQPDLFDFFENLRLTNASSSWTREQPSQWSQSDTSSRFHRQSWYYSSDLDSYYFVIFWFITRAGRDRQAIARKIYLTSATEHQAISHSTARGKAAKRGRHLPRAAAGTILIENITNDARQPSFASA